jgi:hypothetical protein
VLDKDNRKFSPKCLKVNVVMSLIVNIMQNSYACYMKLLHFSEAKKCADYIKSIQADYLKTYLLYA